MGGKIGIVIIPEKNETSTMEERTNKETCQLVFTVSHAVGRRF